MSKIAIIQAFEGLPDYRDNQGKRHSLSLCLALFTLAVTAGNRGFLAMGDWLKCHAEELKALFEVKSLPSYRAIRRVMLDVDYEDYAARLAKFLEISPFEGETVSLDGKTLRGSYQVQNNNPHSEPHPAIILVSAYIAERGLILPPKEVDYGSNEITALPKLIKDLAVKGVVFAFDSLNTQKKRLIPLWLQEIIISLLSKPINPHFTMELVRCLHQLRQLLKLTKDMGDGKNAQSVLWHYRQTISLNGKMRPR